MAFVAWHRYLLWHRGFPLLSCLSLHISFAFVEHRSPSPQDRGSDDASVSWGPEKAKKVYTTGMVEVD